MFFEFCLRKKSLLKVLSKGFKNFRYFIKCFLPVSKMPLAPKNRLRGGGAGAVGLTVGQTMAGG